jgi:hypothetical protein
MAHNSTTIQPKARQEVIVSYPGSGETVLYDAKTNKAHCLNATAAFVWQQCDGTRTVRDIAQQFATEQHTAVDESLVWLALKQFDQARLLEERIAVDQVADVSRRSALRNLGLAAAVALPVVASLLVPEAVNAGSCKPRGAAAKTSSECCSGFMRNGTCL